MGFEDDLHQIWVERVDSGFVYRGMNAKDLKDPLDPRFDPFEQIRPKLYQLFDILQRDSDAGFQFKLIEEHWGNSYEHDLRNIIAWSRNDLNDPRIDFTSNYQHACEYADNWQGSQLKQNLKYITDYLPERRTDAILQATMTEEAWNLVGEINQWVSRQAPEHSGIVLWVRRSCPLLYSESKSLPLNTFGVFRNNIIAELHKKNLPLAAQSVQKILPKEEEWFYASLRQPLGKEYIEKIEEIGRTMRVT